MEMKGGKKTLIKYLEDKLSNNEDFKFVLIYVTDKNTVEGVSTISPNETGVLIEEYLEGYRKDFEEKGN